MAKWTRLIELRKEKGYSQQEMATKCGVSASSYVRWELMQFQPNINQLKTISYVLSVPVDYLIYNDAFTHGDGEYWRQRAELEQSVNAFLAKCPGKEVPPVASLIERVGNPGSIDPEYIGNNGKVDDDVFPNSLIQQIKEKK